MKTNHLLLSVAVLAMGATSLLSLMGSANKTQSRIPVDRASVGAVTEEPQNVIEPKPITQPEPASQKRNDPARCVFKTAFEGEGLDQGFYYKIPGRVMASIDEGLVWMSKAQQKDGGWGAGSHSRQDVLDPHAVQSDPATTAMVAMALHRSGNTLHQGKYSPKLKEALMFLIKAVESSGEQESNITKLTYTQPQSKLGQNIDVVLTSQFLGNIIHDLDDDPALQNRVKACIQRCVHKIENSQTANGSQKGSGWAGVLQSSFATSALENARDAGVVVDEEALDRSRDFQKNNIDVTTNEVVTESAAGVVLYSVSGSTRASAKETAEAKDILKKARAEGKIKDEKVNVDNLQQAGLSKSKAMKYATAYEVNSSAKRLAQDENVMSGFGNNGGEEFLSYLQTGEGMIMAKDDDWKTWYDKMSGRLLKIQNNDGSWSGHHCITSPVFCTATCLLILSVNNDIDRLTMQ